MRTRSDRRAARRKAIERYKANHPYLGELTAKKLADNPQHCSRRCCGNPRKHEKGAACLTIQERRAKDDE